MFWFSNTVVFLLLCILSTWITFCSGKSCTWEEDKVCSSSKYIEGAYGASVAGGGYSLASAKHLSRSTQAGIVNQAGDWVMRMDLPHGQVNYAHINLNPKLTGVPDPHIPVPEAVVHVMGAGNNVAKTVANGLGYFAIAVDGYRFLSAEDRDKPKVAASIAGGYTGAYVGASGGSTVGAWVGGAVGALFGGIGAAPGAAVGSMIGGLFGGITGSQVGSTVAEELTH